MQKKMCANKSFLIKNQEQEGCKVIPSVITVTVYHLCFYT